MSNCSDVPVTDGVWAHQLFNTYMTEFHSYSYRSLPLCSVLCLERTLWSGLCEGWWKHWCLVLCKKKSPVRPLSTPPPPIPFPKTHFLCTANIPYKIKVFYASIPTWKKLCNLPGPQLTFHSYLIFLRIEFHSECPVNIKYLNCFHEEILSRIRSSLILFLCIYNGH